MPPPGATVAGPVLVVTRSAVFTTVVTRAAASDPLLLAGTGSVVPDVLAAMLSSVPAAGAVTVTVRVVVAPLARVASTGHVTTLPAPSTPAFDALTNVTVAGSVSMTTMFGAAFGPAFRTVIV